MLNRLRPVDDGFGFSGYSLDPGLRFVSGRYGRLWTRASATSTAPTTPGGKLTTTVTISDLGIAIFKRLIVLKGGRRRVSRAHHGGWFVVESLRRRPRHLCLDPLEHAAWNRVGNVTELAIRFFAGIIPASRAFLGNSLRFVDDALEIGIAFSV